MPNSYKNVSYFELNCIFYFTFILVKLLVILSIVFILFYVRIRLFQLLFQFSFFFK